MKPPVRIGFLTPYSSIYPFYSQHLLAGWLIGMGLHPMQQSVIQFIPEYTKMGGSKDSLEAIRKLVFFDRVDLVSGLINYKAIAESVPVIEQLNQTAFFFDMGEYIPHFPYLSPNIFYASNQLWQSEFALGNWAQNNYGDGGMVCVPTYESGYHFFSTFQQGTVAAGGKNLYLSVIHSDNQQLGLNLDVIFDEIREKKPAYVHAIFCGNQGLEFLTKWAQSDLHKKVPLLVNEPMAYNDILQDVAHLDLEIYSSMMWDADSETKRNREFVKKFESVAGQKANIYALIGYEAGLVWKELWPHVEKRDWDTVRDLLRKEVIPGPRGDRSFYPQSGFALPQTSILKVTTSHNRIHKIIMEQGIGMQYNAAEFEQIHSQGMSGWLNPFMCV